MNTSPARQEDQTTMVLEGSPGTPSSSTGSAIVGGDKPAGKSAKSCANVLECFICMEPPPDPVAASCGHVFCWPCMYQWLQNQPKPCPVCRYLLRRDLNIIPLYGAGDHARTRSSARVTGSSSSPGESTISDSDCAMIPPRPHNPLLAEATATLEDPNQLLLTPNPLLATYERSLHELSNALVEERTYVRYLTTERANLELEVHDLEHRNAILGRQVQDSDRQIFALRNRSVQLELEGDWKERNARLVREAEERHEREQGLVQRENEMGAQIERLQQRLARAESLLASTSGV